MKDKMTFDEMAEAYHKENPLWEPNRVNVGRFAKNKGYRYTWQKINKKFHYFYIKVQSNV